MIHALPAAVVAFPWPSIQAASAMLVERIAAAKPKPTRRCCT